MNKLDKHRTALDSWEKFEALRASLVYVWAFSVELGDSEGLLSSVRGKLEQQYSHELTKKEIDQLSMYYYKAVPFAHVCFVYQAICCYRELVKTNPELRYKKLDERIESLERSGILEIMIQFRNSVFHIRPTRKMEKLFENLVNITDSHKLYFPQIENLLYEAVDNILRQPGTLFQQKEEDLIHEFEKALDMFRENEHIWGPDTESIYEDPS